MKLGLVEICRSVCKSCNCSQFIPKLKKHRLQLKAAIFSCFTGKCKKWSMHKSQFCVQIHLSFMDSLLGAQYQVNEFTKKKVSGWRWFLILRWYSLVHTSYLASIHFLGFLFVCLFTLSYNLSNVNVTFKLIIFPFYLAHG